MLSITDCFIMATSDGGEFLDMEKFRIYDAEGSFVGIYKYIGGQFVLEKMFYDNSDT